MSGLVFRRLQPTDNFTEITELLHRAYGQLAERGMKYLASHQDEHKTRERCEEGETFIAESEQRIIGTLTVKTSKNSFGLEWYAKEGVTSFHQFAIEPSWQGRGIGNELLLRAEQFAREEGYKELSFDTSELAVELIAFYQKRGYRQVGHCQWDHTNYKSLIFSKSLC